jgi:hypothetical protein
MIMVWREVFFLSPVLATARIYLAIQHGRGHLLQSSGIFFQRFFHMLTLNCIYFHAIRCFVEFKLNICGFSFEIRSIFKVFFTMADEATADVAEMLQLQVSEIEMLSSMFPGAEELALDDPHSLAGIQSYLDGNIGYDCLEYRFGFTLKLNIDEVIGSFNPPPKKPNNKKY